MGDPIVRVPNPRWQKQREIHESRSLETVKQMVGKNIETESRRLTQRRQRKDPVSDGGKTT
jgi:hypothetical protein